MSRDLLDRAAVARRLGVRPETITEYRRRPALEFPPPDQIIGRSAAWHPETIDAWQATRPGRGAGGGRPRKDDGMRYIEIPDSIDRMRYRELWASSVGGLSPGISQAGRLGYQIAADATSAAEYAAALDAAGITHIVSSTP